MSNEYIPVATASTVYYKPETEQEVDEMTAIMKVGDMIFNKWVFNGLWYTLGLLDKNDPETTCLFPNIIISEEPLKPFLQTHNLTDMDTLTHATATARADFNSLQKRIDTADTRITQVNNLQRHIGAYSKNKDVYSQYLRSKRSPKFRQENEKAIATVEGAKAFFDSMGLDNLPSINDLREEYSALAQEKHNCQQAINGVRQLVSDLQSAKTNVGMLLGIEGEPANERTQRKGQYDDR